MPNPAPATVPEPAAQAHPSAVVAITRKGSGKLMLSINAKDLHDALDRLGVPHDGMRYEGRPRTQVSVVSTSYNRLSTEPFLVREYPATFDISGMWQEPPAPAVLETIASSARDAINKILNHYMPVDITVRVSLKK